MKFYSILRALAICIGLSSQAAHASTCLPHLLSSNPNAAYTPLPAIDNGTVTHAPTGLTWERCSEGQSWDGSSCTGVAGVYTWSEALKQATLANASSFAGFTDWRLPNVKELRSLVEECRAIPTINDTIFPNTTNNIYWSSSPMADVSGIYSWGVGFSDGQLSYWTRQNAWSVRLVRGGWNLARP